MSVKVRRYRNTDGWEIDISLRLATGKRYRERVKAPVASKSGALRWGQERERHLLQHGAEQPKKEVPKLKDFAPRFLDGHARANRQKPSSIAAKEMILRVHLLPALGHRKLDAIKNEDVQRLKHELQAKAPKTINNVLTVLNTLLRKAVEWEVIDAMPCSIKLLPISKGSSGFYEFDEYERLVEAAKAINTRTYVTVLLGGDAGLRCGEMIALEWRDVDLSKRQISVRRSDWNGQVTVPKGGRERHLPLTRRLAAALAEHRHLRSPRVLVQDDATPLTRQIVQSRVKAAARRAKLERHGVHLLRHTFCSHLAMRGAPARAIQELAGHKDLSMTQRYMHLSPAALEAAVRLLDSAGILHGRGEDVETEGREEGKR